MRNWNTHVSETTSYLKTVSEYLWGIETLPTVCSPADNSLYQNTYEELKLSWIALVLAPALSYQNTYEELKLSCNLSILTFVTCIRIPMRNWNRLPHMHSNHPFPVSEYLWGIETPIPCCTTLWTFGIRIPMRNWNWMSVWFLYKAAGIRIPMRNWNSHGKLEQVKKSIVSEYLWGIETPLCLVFGKHHSSYQNTYEELKLVTPPTTSPVSIVSEYLWGIETPLGYCPNLLRSLYQNTYEELKHEYSSMYEVTKQVSEYLWGIETNDYISVI